MDIQKNLFLATECKAAIVNVFFESYKRISLDDSALTMIFPIDIEDNPFSVEPENYTSKEEALNKRITHKEIRRAYKLYLLFPEVAEKTFKFVKVHKDLILEPIPAPWKHKDWSKCWEARLKNREITIIIWSTIDPPWDPPWREEFARLRIAFDESRSSSSSMSGSSSFSSSSSESQSTLSSSALISSKEY